MKRKGFEYMLTTFGKRMCEDGSEELYEREQFDGAGFWDVLTKNSKRVRMNIDGVVGLSLSTDYGKWVMEKDNKIVEIKNPIVSNLERFSSENGDDVDETGKMIRRFQTHFSVEFEEFLIIKK